MVQGVGLFPTQVITTNRLKPESHSALRVLTTNVKPEDVRAFIEEAKNLEEHGDKTRVDAIFQVSVSANKALYRTVFGGELEMCQALQEIMKEDFEKAEARGTEKGEKRLGDLIAKLIAANRNDDIAKAATNTKFRNKLYKEFQIS